MVELNQYIFYAVKHGLGYEVIATDDDLPDLVKEYNCFFIIIGQIKSPEKRIVLFEQIKKLGGRLPVVVSPLAYVSKHAKIGAGTIIMHHALINAGAKDRQQLHHKQQSPY